MSRILAIGIGLGTALLGSPAAAMDAPASPSTIDSGATVILAGAATAASQSAATTNEGSSSDGWEFSNTPYLWAAGTKGEIGVPRDKTVEIDKSFIDVLGSLKFAFMGAFDARHRRLILLGDVMYMSLGTKIEGSHDPQFFEGRVDSSTLVATALAGYRVVDKGPLFVDLVAGGRLLALNADVDLSGPLATHHAEASKTSIAPVVGGRFRAPLGRDFGLAIYGDVGGFGIAADLTWQLVGTIQYDINEHWRMAAGYRYFSVDHDTNKLRVDVAMSGPILGFTYRF